VGEVEENGESFVANARLKALHWSGRVADLVLADDSGLEVDALGGAPGVRSARYGGVSLDDDGRNRMLIEALSGVPSDRRGARFVCVLVLARAGRVVGQARGERCGRILAEPRGHGGFGYDPVFLVPELGWSFAELSGEDKLRHSHRGRALTALRQVLGRRLADRG